MFLDEIGDMPLNLQASLLRAVQNQEIVRVGGVAPVPIDTRIVCATHRDLKGLVDEGKFRADLYYRLSVLSVELPALREREDLDWLIDQLLERIAQREGIPFRGVPRDVRARWLAFDWPGNVRQLEAVLLRFLLRGEDGLGRSPAIDGRRSRPRPGAAASSARLQDHVGTERALHIQRVLDDVAGDKDAAARRLGISRATLYRELRRLA